MKLNNYLSFITIGLMLAAIIRAYYTKEWGELLIAVVAILAHVQAIILRDKFMRMGLS